MLRGGLISKLALVCQREARVSCLFEQTPPSLPRLARGHAHDIEVPNVIS